MLHACDQRFDVTGNLENFCKLNKAYSSSNSNLKLVDFSKQKMQSINCRRSLEILFE